MKYHKNSAHIEAVQWFPGTKIEGATIETRWVLRDYGYQVKSIKPGDYVWGDGVGYFYVISKDTFEKEYSQVGE